MLDSCSATEHQLEDLVDRYGLKEIVDSLAVIAYEKAEHIEENWDDCVLARWWGDASEVLEAAATRLLSL